MMKKHWVVLTVLMISFVAVSSARGLCVKASTANLRTGPGMKHKVAWQVYMYMPLERIGRSTNKYWYAVRDADGDTFWVHKGLVTDSYRCAVVNVENANVRKGPGKKYSTVEDSPAQKYYSYKVISRKKNWIKVRDEWGAVGWIRKDLLWIR